jgi:hypothetical protein
MQRSIQTIFNEIIAAKEAEPSLEALDSSSQTAIWRLWAWVIAGAMFTTETLFGLYKTEVEGVLSTKTPGTLLWYRGMCLGFRYGVGLILHNGRIGYPSGDETPPLLARCSVRETATGLLIKIAKYQGDDLNPLTNEEFNSFQAYLAAVKYAGTPIQLVNAPSNKLRMTADIYYDPLLITSTGEQIADGKRIVDEAILSFLRSLPFDGRLSLTSLVAAIKAVVGVSDVNITLIEQEYAAAGYQPIVVSHVPESGYFEIAQDHPLSDSLNYIADV